MSDQWYYAKGNEKLGPVSEAHLKELAEAGKLLPTDKVWQKGMTEWQDARTVAALFPADGPPPLPSDGSGAAGGLKELVWNYICQLWRLLSMANKRSDYAARTAYRRML